MHACILHITFSYNMHSFSAYYELLHDILLHVAKYLNCSFSTTQKAPSFTSVQLKVDSSWTQNPSQTLLEHLIYYLNSPIELQWKMIHFLNTIWFLIMKMLDYSGSNYGAFKNMFTCLTTKYQYRHALFSCKLVSSTPSSFYCVELKV